MAHPLRPSSFALYRWSNPETTCEAPFLAIAEDRSALPFLGNHRLGIAWGIPAEAEAWLARDFAATGESISCDLPMLRYVLDALYSGAARFALTCFDERLQPARLELSLISQQAEEDGPVYVRDNLGRSQRLYPAEQRAAGVTPVEHALVQVFAEVVAEVATACPSQLAAPPPPRYQPATTHRLPGRRRPKYYA